MEKIKMRSRQFPDLTNWEIEEYLKRNDIIIVPVGHCEMLGSCPVDGEYVGAHAWANLIAEEVDALVLPNVTFTAAGGTETGRGTIHMSPRDSFNHVLSLAHSLLIQGFRRQVYIPAHGPTKAFVPAVVQQFFIETKCPAIFLDVHYYMTQLGLVKPFDFKGGKPEPRCTEDGTELGPKDQELGSYKIVDRLKIYPAKGEVDFPEAPKTMMSDNFAPWYMDECEPLFWTTDIVSTPLFFENCRQHGGDPVAWYTREEMEQHAEVGERYMRELAAKAKFPELLAGLRKFDQVYMQGSAIPKNADHLPGNRFSPLIYK